MSETKVAASLTNFAPLITCRFYLSICQSGSIRTDDVFEMCCETALSFQDIGTLL
jgi:hypothetical protein